MTLKEKTDYSIWQLAISFIFGQIKDKIEKDISLPAIFNVQSISVGVWESHRFLEQSIERKLNSYDFTTKDL